MEALRIGDIVAFQSRTYEVRGVSPMTVQPGVVHLLDVETGERVDAPRVELEVLEIEDAAD